MRLHDGGIKWRNWRHLVPTKCSTHSPVMVLERSDRWRQLSFRIVVTVGRKLSPNAFFRRAGEAFAERIRLRWIAFEKGSPLNLGRTWTVGWFFHLSFGLSCKES